jgi:hypothetical protein
MGVRMVHDADDEKAVLYDSLTDWAFGPVFTDDRHGDAGEAVECFLEWLAIDPRRVDRAELAERHGHWVTVRDNGPRTFCGACYEPDEDQPDDMSGATPALNGHR